MIIEYTKALMNKLLKLIDVLYRTKKHNENNLTLEQSVDKNFPGDTDKILNTIKTLLKKIEPKTFKNNYKRVTKEFQSKHNGFVTIIIQSYYAEHNLKSTRIQTHIKISNDQDKAIEYTQ